MRRMEELGYIVILLQTLLLFAHNDYVERMRAHFGNGSMAEINSLSSYARELSTQDREFYFNKLTLTNGVRLQDPCTINEWVEDVSK